MCMQDMAIARRLNWRRVANVSLSAGGRTLIPPNPNRVALAVYAVGSGAANVPLRIEDSGVGSIVNAGYQNGVGQLFVLALTQDVMPGFQSLALYADGAVAANDVWECFPDTVLDAEITLIANAIGKR